MSITVDMNKANWVLLILSALLYALAFIASQQLWWLVFIFLLPFFYVALTGELSFLAGYIWGVIIFGLHLNGILFSIVTLAEGSYFFRLIPPLFIIFYQAFFIAFICWLTNKVIMYLHCEENMLLKLFLWVSALWLFFYWVDRYCLWLFDRCEGYFFMHPLLPLAEQPTLLQLLPILGKNFLTILLLMISAWTAIAIKTKNKYAITLTIVLSAPWLISWFLSTEQRQPPSWVNKIAVLPILFPLSVSFESAIDAASNQFQIILHQYPHVELIIMPESSFSCKNFSISSLGNLWDSQYLGYPITIVFGAFRWEKYKYYNSLYWLHNGVVKSYFDKKHAMVLVERVPSWFNFWFIHDLYFKTVPEMNYAQNKRPILPIMKETSFVPYICSELFFNEWPDDEYLTIPIVAICNDLWVYSFFHFSYVKKLMNLAAKFKAIQWQRTIVYVAFSQAVYFDKYGNEIVLLKK